MLKIIQPQTRKHVARVLSQCSCKFADDASAKKSFESEKSLQKSVAPNELNKEEHIRRTPWHKKDVQYYDLLRTFYSKENNAGLMAWMQQPMDFRLSTIKKWWLKKKELRETLIQGYIPERHNILGPELACAHFIVFRGGAVKFHDDDKWIKAENGKYQLPDRYRKGMYLQAIDCTDMKLKYEGLSNLRNLRNVEWLSLNGCGNIDDFCMDTISNIFSHSLRYLDLRNCFSFTERGLGALYKMRDLKLLYLDDMLKDTRFELTCLLLEELNPELQIKSDVITFEIK